MNIIDIGLIAGAITSTAGIPQLIRVYRTKQVRDISIWQPVLLNIGMILWLIYGIAINDIPLIVADIISIICCSLLIIMIFIYNDEEKLQVGESLAYDTVSKEEL